MKKLSNLFLILGVLSILGAVGLVYHNHVLDTASATHSQSVVADFSALTLAVDGMTAITEQPHLNEGVYIDGSLYLGVLDLPSLGLTLPVHMDFSVQNLTTAPVAYLGYLAEDDLILAAHNYPSQFGTLHTLSLGDTLSITDPNGHVYHYEVVHTSIIHQSEVETLTNRSPWDLTLFTCDHANSRNRFVVRCQRI